MALTKVSGGLLGNLSVGSNNVGLGDTALDAITTGSYNTGIGSGALTANTDASQNTAVGGVALASNTSGANNTGIGTSALNANTTGGSNVAVGVNSLAANTTASNNTAVGYAALLANTTGAGNVAVGALALDANTTGNNNTAIGYTSLTANTTGVDNVCVGYGTMAGNTTGNYNTAMGINAMASSSAGPQRNVAIGYGALQTASNAIYNTAVGMFAGNNVQTGTGSIYIGYDADSPQTDHANEIAIGNGAVGKGSNTGFINSSNGVYQGNNSSSWSTTSDERTKKNIINNDIGLNIINQIQVKNFEYRTKDEVTELPNYCAIEKEGTQLGIIAQEIQAILPNIVTEESSSGCLSVNSDNITWYLVNAVKELSVKCDSLQSEINILKGN